MANGEWYYARNNQQQGPVAVQLLQDMARSGQLQPTDLVWQQGMPNWIPASQVPQFFAAPPAPAYTAPVQQARYGGYYPPQPQPYAMEVPATYLAQAILVTLFCCQPFGIVAIVYAAQVNSKLTAGDHAGAADSSAKAKMWCWVAFGLGLAINGGVFLLALLGAAMEPR